MVNLTDEERKILEESRNGFETWVFSETVKDSDIFNI